MEKATRNWKHLIFWKSLIKKVILSHDFKYFLKIKLSSNNKIRDIERMRENNEEGHKYDDWYWLKEQGKHKEGKRKELWRKWD